MKECKIGQRREGDELLLLLLLPQFLLHIHPVVRKSLDERRKENVIDKLLPLLSFPIA